MEKIKSVISSHRKSTDAPTEPISSSAQRPDKSAPSDMPHPIYDEFTSKHHPGESANIPGNASRFTDTSTINKTPQSQALGTSLLRPDAIQGNEGAHSEAVSTASVKSGVIGHPQAHSSNAEDIHGARHGLKDNASLSLQNEQTNSTGGDRAFPLAGGVSHIRPHEGIVTTSEREPGTKDKSLHARDGEGKQALTSAAAAATTSFGHNQNHDPKDASTQKYHPDALAAATAAAAHSTTAADSHLPAAKNSYSAAAPDSHSGVTSNPQHPVPQNSRDTTQGERHIAFCGSPEASVDASHRPSPLTHALEPREPREPRLHIPGEYPSPTPVTQPSGSSYFQSKDASAANQTDQHDLRHTGTLEHPQTRSGNDEKKFGNHHGKEAALAGGLGAAGSAAYAASKHGDGESAQAGAQTFPSEPSPYSSKKVDPRVDNMQTSSYDQQKFDPTISAKHQGRDAVVTGGGPSHTSSDQPLSESNENQSHNHHGRDAALVGAGASAATAAGVYASQRGNEPNSGPASSTIGPHKSNVANVFDPRVQPDPALQKHHHASQTVDDPAPHTKGPHKSDIANIVDPRVLPDLQKQKAHHKEEPLAGNTTVAGGRIPDAVESYDNHRATQPAASMNDQRYDPLAPGAHNSTGRTSHQFQRPEKEQHHGREAAIVGGLGAAGAGSYAATRGNDADQPGFPNAGTGPTQSQSQHLSQIYQQPPVPQPSYGQVPAAVGGTGIAGSGADVGRHGHQTIASQNPASIQSAQQAYPGQPQYVPDEATQQPHHHYGRDAAVAGGLGAAGAGAYGATYNNKHTQHTGLQQHPTQPPSQPLSGSPNQHQRYDSVQGPNTQEHHQKRDAAAIGTAGALAGAGSAYAYSQKDEAREQQMIEQQQTREQQQAREQQQRSAQKAQEKALHQKQKELEHQHAKELKHHNKLVAAEEKKHHKEMEKEQQEQQHQLDKSQPEDENEWKRHNVFGLLHRDKHKRSSPEENDVRRSGESPRHSKEYPGPGHRASGSLHSSDGEHKGRNKLHKEPPPGHPAREAMEQQHQDHEQSPASGKRHFFSRKRMSGSDHNGDRPISSGMYSADDAAWHHENLAEPHMQAAVHGESYGPGAGRSERPM